MNAPADSLELVIAAGATPSNLSLPELEAVIERGQQTFIEVGRALMEIRDRRLYRDAGYATFEAYHKGRWGWGTSRAHQVMDAAAVAGAIKDVASPKSSTMVEVPENERQARAMLDRLDPEERQQVRAGTAPPQTVRKMTEPVRRPKAETPDEHTQVIELIRRQLTDIRERYGIVTYWQPVWEAIDSLNGGTK